MANKVLVLQDGKAITTEGSANGQVLTWSEDDSQATFANPSSGGVTSVGLTGGTSGLVIGGTGSPITSIGTFELNAPLKFSWNTATPEAVANAGDVAWDADAGTLDLMFEGGNVQSTLGQTLHQRVLNDTGASLAKGVAVYVNGAQGNRVTVALAQANADSTSATIIGIIAHAIADEAEGYVITEGVIKGVNTGGYTEGLPVYLSPTTPGALTQTKPEAPQHLVLVGYCVKADATTGEILVKTQNGYELGELHDVLITSPTSGQILVYDATSGQTRWENASLGSSNGVAVTAGAGSLSVGLDSASSPTLTGLTLSGLTGYLKGNGASALSASATIPVADVSGAAPLESPTFTGTPSLPTGTTGVTQSAGNNTTALATTAFVTAAVAASGGAPYDLPLEIPGTPALSTKVVNFSSVRAFILSTTGHQGGQLTNPSGNFVCTVRKNSTTLGTITFAAGGFSSSITGTLAERTFAAGDVLSVETPAAALGIDTPFCTFLMSLV